MENLEITEKYIDSAESIELKDLVLDWLNSVKI